MRRCHTDQKTPPGLSGAIKYTFMGSRSPAPAPSQSQIDDGVREHLERILASPTFQQGDRLKRFLKFIVLEAVAGRRHELKEYVIGVQVFGKEDTFDPRTDPIVRVQARRLRAKPGKGVRRIRAQRWRKSRQETVRF